MSREVKKTTAIADDGPQVRACAAQHFGPWMVEPAWFERAVAAVKEGLWTPYRSAIRPPGRRVGDGSEGSDAQPPQTAYLRTPDGIAVISLEGQLTKGESSFDGGTSTVRVRQALRQARRDPLVTGAMLLIDSPGGTVSGTAELAEEVAAFGRAKPIHGHAEGLCASAAMWVAAQTDRLSATPLTEIGCIGVVSIVQDTSGKMAAAGVKVHVLATGEYKGAFAPGAPIEPKHLAYLQGRIDEMHRLFVAGVAEGRGMTAAAVQALADGRDHLAARALELGLLDAVENQDQAMGALRAEIARRLMGDPETPRPQSKVETDRPSPSQEHAMSPKEIVQKITAAIEGILGVAAPAALQTEVRSAECGARSEGQEATAAAPATPAAAVPVPGPQSPVPTSAVVPAAASLSDREAIERQTTEGVRAELKKFVDAFGAQGATWFAEGKSFAESQGLHAEALKANQERLAAENKDLKDRLREERGSPEPVSASAVGAAPPARSYQPRGLEAALLGHFSGKDRQN